MKTVIRLVALSLIWTAGLLALAAPARSQTSGSTFRDSVSVEQVLVPVVVRSGSRFVENLTSDDFDLFVDGHRTTIASFDRSAGAPVHTLVLQDLSGSMGGHPKLELSRKILGRLLRTGKPGDLYSLATFAGSEVKVDAEAISDRTAVEAWAAGWSAFGRTAIHDAVSRIPELISADTAWRSAVLLITDGVDNSSEISAREARTIARQSEVPVHVIALVGRQQAEPEGSWSSDPLRLLSWVTGGQFHSIEHPASVVLASEAFMRSLRSQYILGFSTSGIGQLRPRNIRVEVHGRGRKLTYRREYVGTLPGPAR